MRKFDYSNLENMKFDNYIINLIAKINEFKGKQDMYAHQYPEKLTALLEISKIQSVEASNRIEGIVTTQKRMVELVSKMNSPKSRAEEEISGYRDVLKIIHDSYEYMPISENLILQLHQKLYNYQQMDIGGKWKNQDNVIEEINSAGQKFVRFTPLKAMFTAGAMKELCEEYNKAIAKSKTNPLILIPVFILDFLCIHPFNDGNGRMSRLLTLLLLYKSGYAVGKYISIEKAIENTKDTYYYVLKKCSDNWIEGNNNIEYFIRYYLECLYECYSKFEGIVIDPVISKITKPNQVKDIINKYIGKFTKNQIKIDGPAISESTIELVLKELLDSGIIVKEGIGKLTFYYKR